MTGVRARREDAGTGLPVAVDATRPAGRRSGLRFFLLAWACLAVAAAMWSLTTPLFASPDEDAQVVQAVAVAHGQLGGRTIEQPGHYFPVIQAVDVPAYYGAARATTDCFIWQTQRSAGCAPRFTARDTSVAAVETWVGRYPPLYYAIVGLPSLVADGQAAVLAMRVVSAVLCAALLAGGLTALRATSSPAALTAAGLLGVTPTVLFFAGMVNPTGLEIAAGFLTWCVLLPLVRAPGEHRVAPRLLLGAGAATLLVNARPGSAVLALLVAVCLAVAAVPAFWREAVRDRRWFPPVVVAAAGGAVAVLWLLVADPTAGFGGNPAPDLADPVAAFTAALGRTGRYLQEQIGVFGWLNLPVHPVVLVLVGGAVAAVLAAGATLTRGRVRWALLIAVALALVAPAVLQVPSAARLGLIWQGRYELPFTIGLPLLATTALLASPRTWAATRRAAPVLVLVAAAGQLGAFAWSVWRYSYGFGRSPIGADPGWQPPGGLLLCGGLFVVAVGGLVLLLGGQQDSPLRRWLPRRSPGAPAEPVPA